MEYQLKVKCDECGNWSYIRVDPKTYSSESPAQTFYCPKCRRETIGMTEDFGRRK